MQQVRCSNKDLVMDLDEVRYRWHNKVNDL